MPFGLRVAAGYAFGPCEFAASFLLLADGALFSCCLAAEADDGVVGVAVGLGEVTASGVVGVALAMFLACAGPPVAVAPERHPADPAEAARQLFLTLSLGCRLLLRGRGRRAIAVPVVCAMTDGPLGGARSRRRRPVLAALLHAFELAAEGRRGFPVAKRAAGDADRGGGPLLGHPPAEQSRRPLLRSRPLLPAAALVGELLLCPLAQPLPLAGSDPALRSPGVISRS